MHVWDIVGSIAPVDSGDSSSHPAAPTAIVDLCKSKLWPTLTKAIAKMEKWWETEKRSNRCPSRLSMLAVHRLNKFNQAAITVSPSLSSFMPHRISQNSGLNSNRFCDWSICWKPPSPASHVKCPEWFLKESWNICHTFATGVPFTSVHGCSWCANLPSSLTFFFPTSSCEMLTMAQQASPWPNQHVAMTKVAYHLVDVALYAIRSP